MVSIVGVETGVTSASTGRVLSKVTAEESVVAVTAVPAFPAISEKAMLKVTAPSVSEPVIAREAVHDVGPPETEADEPRIVTVGVWTDSEEVKVKVTVSPVFARAVLALLDAIETGESVGTTVSIVMERPDEAVEIFPAVSVCLAFIFE